MAFASEKRFFVALSFPGENRGLVSRVAGCLARELDQERVLYDEFYRAEFARPNLDTYLQSLYHDQSELIVVFLCRDYERKEWPGLEWRAIRDLIKKKEDESIMLIRLDDSAITGLYSIDGVLDATELDPEEVAAEIVVRLQHKRQLNVRRAQAKVSTEEQVSSSDIELVQLEIKRLDALIEGRPRDPAERARTQLKKIYLLEGLIKRLQAEGRPAMAWKFQRQKAAIQKEGRVATPSQKRFEKIIDIDADKNALKEEAQRQKKNA